jgi:hypothetical protein
MGYFENFSLHLFKIPVVDKKQLKKTVKKQQTTLKNWMEELAHPKNKVQQRQRKNFFAKLSQPGHEILDKMKRKKFQL